MARAIPIVRLPSVQPPLIIGGGPAGAAAAIRVAEAGRPVTLTERHAEPADKVCGDFLSAEAMEAVQALGVELAALRPALIRTIRLVQGYRTAEASLPFAAIGLSRRALDEALLSQAVARGATMLRGHTVQGLQREGSGFVADVRGVGEIAAASVFLATGKHDLRGMRRTARVRNPIGLKMYFDLAPSAKMELSGRIDLILLRGGYAGLQLIEHGQAVLCLMISADQFNAAGRSWDLLLDAISQECPHLGVMMARASPRRDRPLAIAGMPYGYVHRVPGLPGLFRLGDQACVIPSFTGDGVAIALHSGVMAADAWLNGESASVYQARLARLVAWQMRRALLVQGCLQGPHLSAMAVPVARSFPGLLRAAAVSTRFRGARV
ncbi:MAG: FAD-dependent monooxygenase [Acetobacteraceae bacterium]|nr:FAD-dependent monooxygenase [Acetobacteraceae bacterium]